MLTIVMDTREKKEYVKEYCESLGLTVERQKLDYGDYGIKVDGVLQPFTVERKNSMDELAGNFSYKSKGRFKREFERSKGNMAVVVCRGDFDDIAEHKYTHPLPPRNYLAQLKQFKANYNVEFYFVAIDFSKFILDLLLKSVDRNINNMI